ncbi:SDR family oxidoreductase [Paracoccus sp. TK19116]|uniref:SDR family oxidoreductase n=1 Tax=Paracoccus albicereus TaxID=2922394 RepID=A0ABT1MSN3_9RHOB|nr:SDR family oxidoreductase [Paracoccus albicereus]MCQ0971323.1 SDR family oxidoreductase [Paracoccus albicereus]
MSVALVTGAGKRIGRAIALSLAGRGYDVAIHYQSSADEAEATAEEARAMGVVARTFQADLLDVAATRALIPDIAAAMGQLSVLVNNASIFEYDNLASATPESWERHIGSNLRAPFWLIQAFAEQAPKADRSGTEPVAQSMIVNMLDQRVLKPTPEFMTYSLAKAGLWALTRTSAQALAPDIRVNGIGPGPTVQGIRQSDEHFAGQRAATILERGADAGDVTAALSYLLEAKAVTGQLICVDGGQHLGWRTPDIRGIS